ncbi:MAG: TIR domain-containing protein [Bacteroidetes bacterium]|nr:TIR domain-containing protein [Bacteroidota bacterium]
MAYRNKTFVSFASEDIRSYRLLQAWKSNQHIDFHFLDAHDINTARDTSSAETINRRLTERLSNTKQVLMLIGDETRRKAARQSSFLAHEVRVIDRLNIPVVFVNTNMSRVAESHRIPTALTDRYSMSVPLSPSIVKLALDDFPPKYWDNLKKSEQQRLRGPYYYESSVYTRLGS